MSVFPHCLILIPIDVLVFLATKVYLVEEPCTQLFLCANSNLCKHVPLTTLQHSSMFCMAYVI